ncbi:MAG: aroH [Gemmatimonadetes bacterium]|jgi:chorismate mutase|nr:aroH [Gemmatimonadota bacterium]
MTEQRRMRALRGATTVADGGSTSTESARGATQELLAELLARNDLQVDDVVSALFTLTPDLAGAAPARAAREAGWHEVPMLTAAEANAQGSLRRCIRVLLHVESTRPRSAMRHVYLGGARVLRPDLEGEGSAGEH